VAAPAIAALLGAARPVEALVIVTAVLVIARHHAKHPPPDRRHGTRIGRGNERGLDRLRLARTGGVGPLTYRRLMRRFGSAAAALAALPGLARAGGRDGALAIPDPRTPSASSSRPAAPTPPLLFVRYAGAIRSCSALLDDAPSVLTVQGHPDILDRRAVAMVGSRNASANGQHVAEAMAEELAAAGLVVVSGMARASTRGAPGRAARRRDGRLRRRRYRRALPARARRPCRPRLPTAAPWWPRRRPAPRRSRAISRAATASSPAVRLAWWWWRRRCARGSLITVRHAQEAGREVYAVPGSPLDPALPRCQRPDPPGRRAGRDGSRRAGGPARTPRCRGRAGAAIQPPGMLLEQPSPPPEAPGEPQASARALTKIL